MDKPKWLCRELISSPFIALATSREELDKLVKSFGKGITTDRFLSPGANATLHFFDNKNNETVCIMAIAKETILTLDNIKLGGLIVHEVMHVWQEYRRGVGEKHPSNEFEAYSVQALWQRFMWEAERRKKEWQTSANNVVQNCLEKTMET